MKKKKNNFPSMQACEKCSLEGIIQAERYPKALKDRTKRKIFDIRCFHKYIETVQTQALISGEA